MTQPVSQSITAKPPRPFTPRPFTRAQALQNAAFLKALERSGNIRLAARETGLSGSTLHHRRRRLPAFAQRWDAVLAVANARLVAKGGCRAASVDAGIRREGGDPTRTRGGEAVVVRRRDGTLQLRRAQPGKITHEAEQMFLSALSATANVRLSAAAAGASVAAFYRRSKRHPGFAREMRLALQMGYERLEMALIEGFAPEAYADDAWRHNEPPPIPPMTADQALQLLYLHHKTAKLRNEEPHRRRRAGETGEMHSARVSAIWRAKRLQMFEEAALAETARGYDAARAHHARHNPPAPALPDLAQVTGWSRASGDAPHHEGRALFGGWRIGDVKGK